MFQVLHPHSAAHKYKACKLEGASNLVRASKSTDDAVALKCVNHAIHSATQEEAMATIMLIPGKKGISYPKHIDTLRRYPEYCQHLASIPPTKTTCPKSGKHANLHIYVIWNAAGQQLVTKGNPQAWLASTATALHPQRDTHPIHNKPTNQSQPATPPSGHKQHMRLPLDRDLPTAGHQRSHQQLTQHSTTQPRMAITEWATLAYSDGSCIKTSGAAPASVGAGVYIPETNVLITVALDDPESNTINPRGLSHEREGDTLRDAHKCDARGTSLLSRLARGAHGTSLSANENVQLTCQQPSSTWVPPQQLPTSLPCERVVKQSLPKADRDRLLSSPRARYPNLKLTTCLKVELDALQLLATKPEADILRSKMGWLGPLSLVTWKRYKGQLLRWLAFLQLLAPDAQPLTLHSYVQDHSTFLLYLAFLKMRGDSSGVETGKHLQLASCVSMWLALTNPTQPWRSWVQSHLVPHYTRLYQAITKLGTHRRAVLQTQALLSPVEQPHAEILLQWQEQFKDNALQQLSKHQAWEALPVEVAHLNLAKWWKRLHTVTKATWSFVPLHELRNVFITHRLDHHEVPGPSTEASAHVMLNSPTTWHAHYDRNKKQRLALEAQANMPLYRQALLQGGARKSKGPAQQKSWGEEGGAAYDDEA
ncbi:hypothetical protein V8C86DRAFT_3031470 [Haematococcus lacustris]